MTVDENKVKGIERIFEAKERFHKDRAKLPIEEKIKILVQLQRIANDIPSKKKNKRTFHPVWDI